MKKITHVLLAMLLGGVWASHVHAATEYMYGWESSGTLAIGKSTTVQIPESGDDVYLKLSGLKAGNPYTFIANGEGADISFVYTYLSDGDMWDQSLVTGEPDLRTDHQARCIVTSDVWIFEYIVEDPDYEYEPGEWNESKISPSGYYLCVSGSEGATINVSAMSGAIEELIPVGDIENPKSITASARPAKYSAKFTSDASYYFTTSLKTGSKYLFATTGGTEENPISLVFDGGDADYSATNVSEQVVTPGNAAYLLTVNSAGVCEFRLEGMAGESFGLSYQSATEGTLGRVTVTTKGTDGKWSIKGASGSYANGETVAILGAQTIVFAKVTGFSTPADQVATPTEAEPDVTIEGVYNDSYDPKDDEVAKATKITPSAKGVTAARTLFEKDLRDHFAFSAKDGVYYNFELKDLVGDATMTIFKKGDATETALAGPATRIAKFAPGKGDYIVRVAHGGEPAVDSQYTLASSSANVGAISFSKTAVSVKKTAGVVKLTVNRSSGEGKVRVRYGTVNGTAQPGVDYVAQSGELVWENGDKKAKTISVKLIPELFAEEALSKKFEVRLEALPEDEIGGDEYLATVTAAKSVAVVTVTETKGKAEKAVKAATVKTETVPLETGTYQGVVAEESGALTNGLPALASVTFTAKDAAKKALSAKVVLAGKTYTFAADTWTEKSGGYAYAALMQVQKVNKIAYTNMLEMTVKTGATAAVGDWKDASAEVVLTMNVPDANNKGVQEEIVYSGELFRNNAKVQDYLYAVTNAVGYYTVSLVPVGVSNADGIPAGNGYLTLTIDNKGKAKVAGMLADGTTKPSYSSIVAVRDDGDTILVPVFVAKSPYCFGGTLRLVRGEDGKFVVDSSVPLIWNNDNALLTYDGEEGWQLELTPVGGYFNTVNNLQAYYLTSAFNVSTAEIEELPMEMLAADYSFVKGVQPNGTEVFVTGNTLSTEKKALTKIGGAYDLENGVNPCNVQVKLARATGLVTGSFSVWSENAEGKQKEITGLKHYGVLLLSRDESSSPFDPEVMTAGFFLSKSVSITYYNEKNQKKTRKFTASMPFNVLAVDQGEPDWYEADWGEIPEE